MTSILTTTLQNRLRRRKLRKVKGNPMASSINENKVYLSESQEKQPIFGSSFDSLFLTTKEEKRHKWRNGI